jgi:hypothetical protein
MKKEQHRYRLTISYWIFADSDADAKRQAKKDVDYQDKHFDNSPKTVRLEKEISKLESEVIL